MAKFHLKKKSKRQPARLRYKIEKKIREHNRKARRQAKKNPTTKKKEVIQVPAICPFKDSILKEAEVIRKSKMEEQKRHREEMKLRKQEQIQEKKTDKSDLEELIYSVKTRENLHENFLIKSPEKLYKQDTEKSLKQYYKEFKKVVEASDIILEVIDARDPLGTRCVQVEEFVKEMKGNKKIVLVLNKSDLVPMNILCKWLKYLRRSVPAIAFKASTQVQNKKLGQKCFSKSEKVMQNSACIGANLLMSLLANYCRCKDIKTSITVGVVGLPNVGKSSIINSLKRSRACTVGATPGITRSMQEVQLDSKIKLLDCPGVVFAEKNDNSAFLKNAVRVSSISDPILPANVILQKISKQYLMELYDISDYSTPEEFYYLKAKRSGRLKKGGIPDTAAAARSLLEDWNNGKIRHHTVPPEIEESSAHISSEIVTEVSKEFNLDEFESMETEILNKFEECENIRSTCCIESNFMNKMDDDNLAIGLLDKNITAASTKKKSQKDVITVQKKPAEMELEGNQKLNKIKKQQFKKEKKQSLRRSKVAQQLAEVLENVSINNDTTDSMDYDYDFKTDFSFE